MNVFIMSNITNKPLVGCVWSDKTVFPDFNHPNASKFWGDSLKTMHDNTPYDGIWLDMNEIETFTNGELVYEN